MTTEGKLVLVTGATGHQGGGAARALLARGHRVRAFVRNPGSERAVALGRLGAELAVGDLGDRASLEAAARGVDAVFSVQPSEGQPEYGATSDDEVRFGRNVADAAKAAAAGHLVYTSMAGLEPGTGVGHFERDIGAVAAAVFERPEAFAGRTLELAGEVLTGPEVAAAVGRATGRPLAYARFSAEALGASPVLARVVEASTKLRADVDVAALRALHPGLKTLAAWLDGGGAALVPRGPR